MGEEIRLIYSSFSRSLGFSGSLHGWPSRFLTSDNARVGCLVLIWSTAHLEADSVTHLRSNYKTSVKSQSTRSARDGYHTWMKQYAIRFYHAWSKSCRYNLETVSFWFLLSRYPRRSLLLCLICVTMAFILVWVVLLHGSGVKWHSRNHFLYIWNFKGTTIQLTVERLNIERDDMIINSRNP